MRTALGNNTQTGYFSMPNHNTGVVVIDPLGDRKYTFSAKDNVLHFLALLNKDPAKKTPSGRLYEDLNDGKQLIVCEKRLHNQVEKIGTLVRDGECFVDTHTYSTMDDIKKKYPGKDHSSLQSALTCLQFTYRMRMKIAPGANSELLNKYAQSLQLDTSLN